MKHGCRVAILLTTTLLATGYTLNVSSEARQGTSANSVLSWNEIAMTAIATSQITTGGARQSRAGAMVQVAVHDALNAIEHRYEPYAIAADAPGASADAAVASAAYHVLVGMFPYEATTLDPQYADALAAIPDGQAKTHGIAVGQTVAQGILDLRANDNSAPNTSYTFGPPDPGVYQPTPPFYLPPVEPHWGEVAVFGLESADQFRPDGPDSVFSAEYATDFNEVKWVGSSNSTTRTRVQSEIGQFWLESTPFTWNRIARVVSAVHPEKDAWEIGRLLAMENVALADAFIAGYEAKYFYNFWRPVTAIRATDDVGWLPWGIPHPRHPDYVSGHSIGGGAAAAVLADAFGDDQLFTFTTPTAVLENEEHVPRSYSSFSQAADENSNSRVYVGFHFRKACRDGQRAGRQIGHFLSRHILKPL